MRLTKAYAVLLAALMLALGPVAVPRWDTAAANEDVELLMPGGENGDPDTGGGARYYIFGFTWWGGSPTRVTVLVRVSPQRQPCMKPAADSKRRPVTGPKR